MVGVLDVVVRLVGLADPRQRVPPGPGVLAEPAHTHGIAVGIGVNPWYGEIDPERMAHAVVDEAIRNVVAVGGDPDKVALLDNFSWGDPRPATREKGERFLAIQATALAQSMRDERLWSAPDPVWQWNRGQGTTSGRAE